MGLFDFVSAPGDTDEVRAVAAVLAGLERDLHEAVQDHYEALGIDPPAELEPPAERIDRLCRLVEHHLDNDLWGYFLTEQAPDSLKNAEAAAEHAAKSDAEWQATIQQWAAAAPKDTDLSERECADRIVRQRFGLDLETFEKQVVDWSPERTLKNALRGPADTDIQRIRAATAALEGTRE